MIELRVLFVLGLVLIAVLASAAVIDTFALAGWIRGVVSRRREIRARRATPSARWAPELGNGLSSLGGAERIVRSRQAAWRLRC